MGEQSHRASLQQDLRASRAAQQPGKKGLPLPDHFKTLDGR